MNNLLVAPIALPMAAAIALLFTRERPAWSRALSLAANVGGLVVAAALVESVRIDGIQTLAFGGWAAPFGIVFTVDMLGALMVLVTMVVSTATLAFACSTLPDLHERMFFYPLFQLLLMGVNGSFLTGDLFNLFVWFEVLLISSYALMSLGSTEQQLAETFKYALINVVSSSMFLVGIALVYSLTGTLNMADLAVRMDAVDERGLVALSAALFVAVFSIKAALFPVYVWLPRAYFAPPTVISGLFGGLLTKVGVYALFRVTTLIFPGVAMLQPLLLFIAGATMFFGVLGALSQWDMKRVLSYHIVSQIGYMIMGLGLWSPAGWVGGIYYMIHHILVKTSLFLVAGAVEASRGTTNLRRLGGLVDGQPGLSTLFVVAGLGLAGVPPLSGFVAKLVLMRAGLEQSHDFVVFVSVVVSFLTLFSMMKIFRYGFWRDESSPQVATSGGAVRATAIASLVLLGVAMGLGAEWGLPYAELAAEQLADRDGYIAAVLGERP